MTAIDLLGQEVNVGDRVAVGFRSGNHGTLRIGRVVSFGTRKNYPENLETLNVEWHVGSSWNGRTEDFDNKVSWIDANSRRFVKIG